MVRLRKLIERFMPIYAVLPLICCFLFNTLIYTGTRLISAGHKHYDMTLGLDKDTPYIQWTVLIYFGCFAFWALNYIIIGSISREHCYRFCVADMLSRVVCAIFFIFLPTTNVRPAVVGEGFIPMCMRFLYWIDPADNLFPSIHCLVSWFCYIGIRGQKKIPLRYRIFSLIAAFAVFVSTLTTKQHVLVDVISGVLIAEVLYRLSQHFNWWEKYAKVADRVTEFVFRCKVMGDESESKDI